MKQITQTKAEFERGQHWNRTQERERLKREHKISLIKNRVFWHLVVPLIFFGGILGALLLGIAIYNQFGP